MIESTLNLLKYTMELLTDHFQKPGLLQFGKLIGKLRSIYALPEGEHDLPDDWECLHWKAHGGYGWRKTATAI